MLLTTSCNCHSSTLPRYGCHPTAELGTRSGTQGQGNTAAPIWLPGEGHPEKHSSSYHKPGAESGRDFPCCLSKVHLQCLTAVSASHALQAWLWEPPTRGSSSRASSKSNDQ